MWTIRPQAMQDSIAGPMPNSRVDGSAHIYKAKIIRLTEALADPELRAEAAEAIRSLVGEVVLMPGEKRGKMQAVPRGELMGILDFVARR
jgi:hypothetical protein